MSGPSCLNCRFSDPATPKGFTSTLCRWLTAECEGGDRIPEWAHDFLREWLEAARGAKLVHNGSAETCPAYARRDPGDQPAGPLSEIITKGGAQ